MPLQVYRKRKKGETVEQQLEAQAKHIAGLRKKDAAIAAAKIAKKKRRSERLKRFKKDIKTILTGPGHSPASKKYLRSK